MRPMSRAAPLSVVLLAGVLLGSAPAAHAVWGTLPVRIPPRVPIEKTWLQDLPERPGARARGKIAVFELKGDDVYQPVREAIVRMLRRRGFYVTVTLRPADSALEYREMSRATNMAVYVEGDMKGEGARQKGQIRLFSGLSGHRMATLGLSGPTDKIVGDLERTFWTRVGPAITRACTAVSKPRREERAPLLIDAGDPVD
jgi:hypothetical protein